MRYVIEGTWLGYSSRMDRVCHREVTTSKARAEWCERHYGITFTDGTTLRIEVRPAKLREKIIPVDSYGQLITDCVHYDVASVAELQEARNKARMAGK